MTNVHMRIKERARVCLCMLEALPVLCCRRECRCLWATSKNSLTCKRS